MELLLIILLCLGLSLLLLGLQGAIRNQPRNVVSSTIFMICFHFDSLLLNW